MSWFQSFESSVQFTLFGVCTHWAKKLGMNVSKVRVYFIYLSFLTAGSPILFYLIWAFWLEHKSIFYRRKRSVWDF